MKKNLYLGLGLIIFSGCSQNFEKIYDCDGVEVIFNDYDRLFVVGGVDLSSRKGFFMNQTTVFGKFYENADGVAMATFSKSFRKFFLLCMCGSLSNSQSNH
jgi:hypothetical protein